MVDGIHVAILSNEVHFNAFCKVAAGVYRIFLCLANQDGGSQILGWKSLEKTTASDDKLLMSHSLLNNDLRLTWRSTFMMVTSDLNRYWIKVSFSTKIHVLMFIYIIFLRFISRNKTVYSHTMVIDRNDCVWYCKGRNVILFSKENLHV